MREERKGRRQIMLGRQQSGAIASVKPTVTDNGHVCGGRVVVLWGPHEHQEHREHTHRDNERHIMATSTCTSIPCTWYYTRETEHLHADLCSRRVTPLPSTRVLASITRLANTRHGYE